MMVTCDFNLHFPNDVEHLFVCLLTIFSLENVHSNPLPIFKLGFFFIGIELQKVFINFGDESFVS